LSRESHEKLVAGLRRAVSSGVVDWSPLAAAIAQQEPGDAAAPSASGVRGGMRKLEVWEIQEWSMFQRSWGVSSGAGVSWRWVDSEYRKHPNIRTDLSQNEAAQSCEPPCLLHMFEPYGNWRPTINEDTDNEGWRYASSWAATSWDGSPSPMDSLRKRLWTRNFV